MVTAYNRLILQMYMYVHVSGWNDQLASLCQFLRMVGPGGWMDPWSICPRTDGPLGSVCPKMDGLPTGWMDLPGAFTQNIVSSTLDRNVLDRNAVGV